MDKLVILIRNAASTDFGGAERFPVFLALQVANASYRSIIFSRSSKLLHFAADHHVAYHKSWWWQHQTWSGLWILLTPLYFVWQLVLVAYYLLWFTRLRPTVVHIQSKDDFIAATIAGRLTGARVIWTDHADLKHIWKNMGVWYKNPTGKLVAWSARFAHAITVVSNSERELISAGIPHRPDILRKMRVIYNGAFDKLNSFQKTTTPSIIIACTSRMVIDKGIGELIIAYEHLRIKHPNTELLLIGDGPDRHLFEEMAHDNPDIHFVGHKDDPLPLLCQADIFAHPTYHEGFSLSLVEAAMMQKAIIATNVGGNPEIIQDGVTGLLVPPKNVEVLESALTRLVKDGDERKRLGIKARNKYLSSFQFEHIAQAFTKLYSKF